MADPVKPMRLSPLNPDNRVREETRGALLPFAQYSDGGVQGSAVRPPDGRQGTGW
jgi:hypothetical protein